MTELLNLAPGQIEPHPDNPRRNLGDLKELTTSVLAHGILEPLVVVPIIGAHPDSPQWRVVAGHRRLAAAQAADLFTVPALARSLTPVQQLEVMLVENLQRSDLTPVEEGRAYQQLLAFDDYTPNRIAKNTGRSTKTVKARIAITGLPDTVLDKIDAGQLSLADAEKLLPLAGNPDALARVEKYIGTYNFQWALQTAVKDQTRVEQNAALIAELAARGVTPTPWPGDDVADESLAVKWLQPRFTVDEHEQKCEFHDWYVDDDGWVEAVCTLPTSHKIETSEQADRRAIRNGIDAGEAGALRGQLNALNDDLAVANQQRRTWLRDNVTDLSLEISDTRITNLLRHTIYTLCDDDIYDVSQEALDLLGIAGGENESPAESLRGILDEVNLSEANLIKIIYVLTVMPEESLTSWGWSTGANSERLRQFNELGYHLNATELAALELGDKLRVEVEGRRPVVDVHLPEQATA